MGVAYLHIIEERIIKVNIYIYKYIYIYIYRKLLAYFKILMINISNSQKYLHIFPIFTYQIQISMQR